MSTSRLASSTSTCFTTTDTVASHPSNMIRLSSHEKSSQANNKGARPPNQSRKTSLTKATTSKFVNMVPSLSKKMTDSNDSLHYITDLSPKRRNSYALNNDRMRSTDNDLTLSYRRRQLSLQASHHSVDNSTYNKQESVLKPMVPSSVPASPEGTKRRPSRDLITTSMIQQRQPSILSISSSSSNNSKQNKTETLSAWTRKPPLRVATLAPRSIASDHSNSDSDDGTTGTLIDQQHLKQQPQYHHNHHHHQQQPLRRRRTSITSSSMTHDPSTKTLLRRRSMADGVLQQERLLQAQARLRPPSWLESAGFMRQSKCAACHPESPTPISILTPPVGVGVPAFGIPPDLTSRSSSRCSFLYTGHSCDYNNPSSKNNKHGVKDEMAGRRLSSPNLDLTYSLKQRNTIDRRRSFYERTSITCNDRTTPHRSFYEKTTCNDRTTPPPRSKSILNKGLSQSPPSSCSSASTATTNDTPLTSHDDLKQLVTQLIKDQDEQQLQDHLHDPHVRHALTTMMDDLVADHPQVCSGLSSAATLVDHKGVQDTMVTFGFDPPPLSDLEQLAAKFRSVLGKWFTDLNHGQLERYDTAPDGSITTMTISGSVLTSESVLISHLSIMPTGDRHSYLLNLGPEERKQTFRIAGPDRWTPDNQINHCQFRTKSSQCETEFDWVNRRHHCRRCGDIFCKAHSTNRLPLFADDKPNQIKWSRVCDSCCYHLVGPYLMASS
ncbi:hypothetical protein BC941DRAFT_436651 [Chlamydoabsidia padenii]|nr:hypothetical protein BC941DRAFT_436651 [Chlamydoabsidia padenii]